MQKSDIRICFIMNPAADRNRSSRHIDWLQRESEKRWNHVEIVITKKSDDVTALANEKANRFDTVVACGGDGTVNQVVNGIAETGAALGVLPIGSGNDFVKTVKLNKSLPECLEILYRHHLKSIDLIRFDGDVSGWCANTIGFGLDGWANHYAGRYKKLKGHVVYVLGALRAAFSYPGSEMEVIIDGKKSVNEYLMLTTCNGKYEGGSFYIAPEADMTDGLLDVLIIKKIPVYKILLYLPGFRWGPSPLMKGVTSKKGKKIQIKSIKPAAVHCDGEHLGISISKLNLEIVENALKVVTPENY